MLTIRPSALWAFAFLVYLAAPARAQRSSAQPPDAKADSIAMRLLEASGGAVAWAALPYLGFSYSVQRGRDRVHVVRHMWNRRTHEYRMEVPGPTNEPYVVLFNIHTRKGRVYWDGTELDEVESDRQLKAAYARFLNDAFWLVAPFTLFDPGVERTYMADSSNASMDVLRIGFTHQAKGPAQAYLLYIHKATGRLARWSYRDAQGGATRSFAWEGLEERATAAGPLLFATYKRGIGTPFAVVTEEIATPALVEADLFTASAPRLYPDALDQGPNSQ